MDPITERLIRENADAPVDRLIRAIYATCSAVEDAEESEPVPTAEAALELWYGVDDLTLIFELPKHQEAFVRLIHQRKMTHPQLDDISDYSVNCDSVPEIAATFQESGYRLIYTD